MIRRCVESDSAEKVMACVVAFLEDAHLHVEVIDPQWKIIVSALDGRNGKQRRASRRDCITLRAGKDEHLYLWSYTDQKTIGLAVEVHAVVPVIKRRVTR